METFPTLVPVIHYRNMTGDILGKTSMLLRTKRPLYGRTELHQREVRL